MKAFIHFCVFLTCLYLPVGHCEDVVTLVDKRTDQSFEAAIPAGWIYRNLIYPTLHEASRKGYPYIDIAAYPPLQNATFQDSVRISVAICKEKGGAPITKKAEYRTDGPVLQVLCTTTMSSMSFTQLHLTFGNPQGQSYVVSCYWITAESSIEDLCNAFAKSIKPTG